MQRQSQWDSLLTPVIYHHFDIGASRVPSKRAQLFNIQPSTLSAEKGTGVGGMGLDAWDQYQASGQPGELDFSQGYTTTYTHVEYPVQFRIEKKLILNDQYGIMGKNIQKVGRSAEYKMEQDAASLLNNFVSATHVGGDAVALCSASHPTSPHDATVMSNLGTTALSANAIKATRILMGKFTDDKGNLIGVTPNELWVPPDLEDTALSIVGATHNPDNAENASNPQNAGRWSVIPWSRLSGMKAWFMVDGVLRQEAVNWYDREAFQLMLIDETTTYLLYEAKLHYSFGWDDFRWIYGQNPS